MKHPSMKHIVAVVALVALSATARAQQGLAVENVFSRFGHQKGCKMVVMHDTELRGYQLSVYKSLAYKNLAAQVAPYLKADRKKAKKIREVVENGRVVSGYYMMPPLKNGMNRYVLFSTVSKQRGAVIYIEGTLSADDIMKICYTKE